MTHIVNKDALDGFVKRFQEAWHKADEEGKVGSRTEAGMIAALEPVLSLLEDVQYHFQMYEGSTSGLLNRAHHLGELGDRISDFTTYHPGYEYRTGTLPWAREED